MWKKTSLLFVSTKASKTIGTPSTWKEGSSEGCRKRQVTEGLNLLLGIEWLGSKDTRASTYRQEGRNKL